MSVYVITTWTVTVESETWRVPETELDHFLRVLTFNKRSFSVEVGGVQTTGPEP